MQDGPTLPRLPRFSGSPGGRISLRCRLDASVLVRAFVIGRRAEDVEVAVEVDIDLAAVLAGDLDLVVALFVADLGAGNLPPLVCSSATS